MTLRVEITDEVVWAKHLEEPLKSRVLNLRPDARIELAVDGIVGEWRKMKTGRDGRPTQGIRPIGPMAEIWKQKFRPRKGEWVTIREVRTADRYLEGLAANLGEWDSAEDEDAYRDLQPV